MAERLENSQRLEAIGVLAGGVAHDFNNLLHSMSTSMELLEVNQNPRDQAALITNIRNAVTRATDLVAKLLGFARKGKYQEKLLDIRTIANNAAELFKVGLLWVAIPMPIRAMT